MDVGVASRKKVNLLVCLRKITDKHKRITEKRGRYYPDFKLFLQTQSSTLRSTLFEKPSNVDQHFLKKVPKKYASVHVKQGGRGYLSNFSFNTSYENLSCLTTHPNRDQYSRTDLYFIALFLP